MKLGRFLLIYLITAMIMGQLILSPLAPAVALPDLPLITLWLVLPNTKLPEASGYILLAAAARELLAVSGFGWRFVAVLAGGYLFYFLAGRLAPDGSASRLGLAAFLAALAANLLNQFSPAYIWPIMLSALITTLLYLGVLSLKNQLKLGMS